MTHPDEATMRTSWGRDVRWAAASMLLLVVVLVGLWWWLRPGPEPILVGIVHSVSGPMAESEKAVLNATVLALEQINAGGGLLGRPVRWIIADGESSEKVFEREARRLIERERVSVLFGCWTSASRKAVVPVVEGHDHLLFYPLQYEGCEQSRHVVYLGAAPNQQIIPAVSWAAESIGPRFFLVGSNYIFPRVANAIIHDQARALGASIVGEAYLPLGSVDVDSVVAAIRKARPDVILNTINGSTNDAFFQNLEAARGGGPRIPVLSFSLGESELAAMPRISALEGHYAAWNYFQSLETPANRRFVAAFQARYGADHPISDPMEAAYCGVMLWAQAAREAGTVAPEEVRQALPGQSLDAPEGRLSIDIDTQHAWKTARVGQIRADRQFEVVWTSDAPIRPAPYPILRNRSAWESLLGRLRDGWGGQWSSPAETVQFEPLESPDDPFENPFAQEAQP